MATLDLVTVKAAARRARSSSISTALLRMAAQDWMLFIYLVAMATLTLVRRGGSALPIVFAVFDLAWFAVRTKETVIRREIVTCFG